jgi:hypothetical protein
MMENKFHIGKESKPRFEFRTFGKEFTEVEKRMSELSAPVPKEVQEKESNEIYIMSRTNDINNIKLREKKMDIKTYVQTIDGLEQWDPLMKVEFPISKEVLLQEIFPAFQVEIPEFDQDNFSIEEFLQIVNDHKDLQAVQVQKHRFGYMVNDTICEVANVLINGAWLVSIGSESTEVEDIQKTLKDLGLEGVENINYMQAIKRVIGMSDKDLAN